MSGSPPSSSSANSPLAHRQRYPLRRSPTSRKRGVPTRNISQASFHSTHASLVHSDLDRGVLLPLHQNLRRLPSRVSLADKLHNDTHDMLDSHINVRVGGKRKRVASGSNENTHHAGRPTRGTRQLKRFKSSSNTSEDDRSSMDIDSDRPLRWATRSSKHHDDEDPDEEESDEEISDEDEEDEEEENTSDEYFISSAPSRVLNRLRKDELIRLYSLAGLSGDAEDLTKSDIIDSIIDARDDIASLPPSSPLGRGGGFSDYSSDDGMPDDPDVLDDETPRFLRRRATTNDVSRSSNSRPVKSRSLSMGNVDICESGPTRSRSSRSRQKSGDSSTSNNSSRRRSSRSSSNSTSNPNSAQQAAMQSISSPPAHHLRSRKVSAPTVVNGIVPLVLPNNSTDSSSSKSRSKGKAKQVEFDHTVALPNGEASESDLTDLEELEARLKETKPQVSPRRLRSKDKEREREKEKGKERPRSRSSDSSKKHSSSSMPSVETLEARRITPMRKAKRKIKTLKEDSEADEDEEEIEMDDEEEAEEEEEDEVMEGDTADEDEVDELVSETPTVTPRKPQRTPLKKRLRSRKRAKVADPSDGDDEQDEEQEMEEAEEEAEEEVEEADEDGQGEADDDDDDQTVAVEPRKLRSGKIVGEEDVDMDGDDSETIGEEDEEDEEEEGEMEGAGDEDIDAEGETDEEAMEEVDDGDVDLTVATTKTLVRMRRDDLIRLCESRELEAVGTKPQLAEALLQWRDRQQASSPSSTGTARPPSTVKRRHTRRRQSQDTATPPVLLRNGRVHLDEPRTPSITEQERIVGTAANTNTEPELELDLGTLGLEDREIPPDKLQKLEKIGSGGFKDVYIGKLKGRKIAIAEFRGQLSAMDIKELKLLGGFDHPNIVRFLGVSIPENTKETPVMIVSELCTNGDLFDYIRNVNPPTLHKVLTIMLDIARGLEYLHTRKPSVIHRDCKSSNILITSKGNAKIADFGLAKVKQSTRSMVRSLVGTVNWQAPELWHAHPKYNHKVDVFSCACVYWEMLQWHLPNKKYPWEGMNEHAIYDLVGTKRQRPSLSGLKKQWCPEIVELIEHMWAQDHQDRPTMSEVVERLGELVKIY